jgi:hypothetical protein|eukprot:COSAG01_NODE_6941_length_3429_cov_69.840841_3_plen_102_part_00
MPVPSTRRQLVLVAGRLPRAAYTRAGQTAPGWVQQADSSASAAYYDPRSTLYRPGPASAPSQEALHRREQRQNKHTHHQEVHVGVTTGHDRGGGAAAWQLA